MPPKTKKLEQLAYQLKDDGNEAFLSSQYKKAVDLYTQAISLEENPIFYNNRSQAYFYIEEFEFALQDCNTALELKPDYLKAVNNKAQILFEMGRVQEAILILSKVPEPSSDTLQLLKKCREHISKVLHYLEQFINLGPEESDLRKYNNLIEWLRQGKATFPKVRIEHYDKDYRGIHATKTINPKETILFMPRSHLITLEMAKDTTISRKILQYRLDLLSPKHSFLATFLLQEKYKVDSFWQQYLAILPQHYGNFPIFYKNEDLEWLQGSPFLKQVKEKLCDLQKDYHDICLAAPDFEQYKFEDFCWARMTASSRIFGITIKGVKTDAFVPMADMLNHRRPKQTSWMYSDERQGFIIEADEKIERGQTIYDSYGRKCNSRFLLNYGFIVEQNDANEVQIAVSVDLYICNDPLMEKKEDMIYDCLTGTKYYRISEETEDNNVMEFMGYIRFLQIKEESHLKMLQNQQSMHISQTQGYKPQKTPPVSIQNEMDMWEHITQVCVRQLGQYPTTYEQDQEIHKTFELTTNQKNCLMLRMGEKEILWFYITMGEKVTKLMRTLNKKEINKFCANSVNFKYINYVNRVVTSLFNQQDRL